MTKESAYNESERELTYTLKVNEQGKTINNGTPLTLKDEMSNATPDLSSIVVKELGSGQTLAKSEWSVTYALNAQGHSVMEITLPDGKQIPAFARGARPELSTGTVLSNVKLTMRQQDTVAFYVLESYEIVPQEDRAA